MIKFRPLNQPNIYQFMMDNNPKMMVYFIIPMINTITITIESKLKRAVITFLASANSKLILNSFEYTTAKCPLAIRTVEDAFLIYITKLCDVKSNKQSD